MMKVRKTSVFPAAKEEIFVRLQEFETLQYIAYPYATFMPIDGSKELIWRRGMTASFQFKLFRCIPFGIHTINVMRFGSDEGIFTEEGNKFVPVWNHEIILEAVDEKHTKYTDIVEIDAGWKTLIVYWWAVCFYGHRQKKWLKLLKQENKL